MRFGLLLIKIRTEFANYTRIYHIGEILTLDYLYLNSYMQPNGPLSGVLAYLLYYNLNNVFCNSNSMNQLESYNSVWSESLDLSYVGIYVLLI